MQQQLREKKKWVKWYKVKKKRKWREKRKEDVMLKNRNLKMIEDMAKVLKKNKKNEERGKVKHVRYKKKILWKANIKEKWFIHMLNLFLPFS